MSMQNVCLVVIICIAFVTEIIVPTWKSKNGISNELDSELSLWLKENKFEFLSKSLIKTCKYKVGLAIF